MKPIFRSTPRTRRARPQQHQEVQPDVQTAFFQPKLSINAPGDQYEREADAVADTVVNDTGKGQPAVQRMPISTVQRLATPEEEKMPATNDGRMAEDKKIQEKPMDGGRVQKMDAPKEEEKPVQKMDAPKEEEKPVQKAAAEEEEPVQKMDAPKEEEKPVQKAAAPQEEEQPVQAKAQPGASKASPDFSARLSARKGQGQPLPAAARTQMEQGIGADFSRVRIHTDPEAAEMNKDIHAQAFTHGSDVYFNSGKFSPESTEGKRLLAHELTHVVQQGGGGEKIQMEGGNSISENEWIQLEENFKLNFVDWIDSQMDSIQFIVNIFAQTKEDEGGFKFDSLFTALVGLIPIGAVKDYSGVAFAIAEKLSSIIAGFSQDGSISFLDFSNGLLKKYGDFKENRPAHTALWNKFKGVLTNNPKHSYTSANSEIGRFIQSLPNTQTTKERIITSWVNSSSDSLDLDDESGMIYLEVLRSSLPFSKSFNWIFIKGPMIDDVLSPMATKKSIMSIYGDVKIENLPFKMIIRISEDVKTLPQNAKPYPPVVLTKENAKGKTFDDAPKWNYTGTKNLYETWMNAASVHPKVSQIDDSDT